MLSLAETDTQPGNSTSTRPDKTLEEESLYKVRDYTAWEWGRFLGQAWEQTHLTPWTPTLLIQDLRLHTAFLLFTASHSRLWPEGGKRKPRG